MVYVYVNNQFYYYNLRIYREHHVCVAKESRLDVTISIFG